MLRRCVAPNVLRRIVPATVATTTTAAVMPKRSHYNWHIWYNPTRQPQLTAEQREKVVVDTSKFPAEFKDYDEWDPYKNFPLWIEGMHTWSYFLLGAEIAFIWTFYDMVFPQSI